MNTWLMTDSHFGHGKILEYCREPGYEQRIRDGLREIAEGDLLIHLGDVSLGNDDENHRALTSCLAGVHTILVRGNHDSRSDEWYYRHGWDAVVKQMALVRYGYKIFLSHAPIPLQKEHHLNIHGHTHGNRHRDDEFMAWYTGRHIDISPEIVGFRPLSLKSIVEDYGKKTLHNAEAGRADARAAGQGDE